MRYGKLRKRRERGACIQRKVEISKTRLAFDTVGIDEYSTMDPSIKTIVAISRPPRGNPANGPGDLDVVLSHITLRRIDRGPAKPRGLGLPYRCAARRIN
jgi:hypothetical protein